MIVEDGTGLVNADSYVSVAFADTYFSARGVSEWALLTQAKKEQALIKATDFIDNVYQWNGKREFEQQALRFPRTDIQDYEGTQITGIPNCLKQAVCDAAYISNSSELFETAEHNGDVVSETITTLSFSYSKEGSRSTTSTTLYDSINTKLRGLFKDNSKKSIVTGDVQRV